MMFAPRFPSANSTGDLQLILKRSKQDQDRVVRYSTYALNARDQAHRATPIPCHNCQLLGQKDPVLFERSSKSKYTDMTV